MLMEREQECGGLERLLAGVRDGLSGVLVLRGEAGIGKTALLEHAAGSAADMHIALVTGVESEMELGFAGLHQLLMPFLDGLGSLPAPQREALRSVFGFAEGPAPDRFLVGLAALTLITQAAAERPVLCVIDDAQWLDRASVALVGFVARRLFADRVGMLFAIRDGEPQAAGLEGLPECRIGGLSDKAAHELLAACEGRFLDPRVARRIVAEAAGNPLAVLEFASELAAEELAGAASLARPLRAEGRLETLFLSRVRALPHDARMLLLVAAAEPLGDPSLTWRAAEQLGINPEAAVVPGAERLLSFVPRVKFRHPLMRSAAYHAASAPERRRAHEALAAVIDRARDPDRRAWHLADAAGGPDEQVAAELERSADRARSRSGWASGAAFLERAAELTPDTGRRARRRLEAASAMYLAGDPAAAQDMLGRAEPQLADPLAAGKARRLEGLIADATGDPPKTPAILLDAAGMISPYDRRLARDTLLEAVWTAYRAGRFGVGMAEALRAVRATPRAEDSPATVGDFLLDGFAALADHRDDAGVRLLRRALGLLTGGQPIPDDVLEIFMVVSYAATVLYDDVVWRELNRRWVAQARERGAVTALLLALVFRAFDDAAEGRFGDAEAAVAEGRALGAATGDRVLLNALAGAELYVLAWRGREAAARSLGLQVLRGCADQGDALAMRVAHGSLAVLELGLGNYQPALCHGRGAFADEPVATRDSEVDLVEAAVRCGDRGTAAAVLEAFSPRALAIGTDYALGELARCRALLAGDDRVEPEYRLAIEHLQRCRITPQLARTRLLYGEWLRRQRRRRDAREQLRAAFETFDSVGAEAFAERARTELQATGERVRKRAPGSREVLTAQEAQVARLASEGALNKEIAAQLFLSTHTVEYHLHKVFRKLGMTNRAQLGRALARQDGPIKSGEAPPPVRTEGREPGAHLT
ncbi:MAG: AAA family ATPase [Streptosporangiaceae bacterium]|nr:AAA family ATPase [Streptosporangiaceae bacterium]